MFEVKEKPRVGFSLVEFLIVLSTAIILLSSVDSWLANYETRGRVSEALSVAETAKTEIVVTCSGDPAITELTQHDIAHDFPDSPYVDTITVSGTCEYPQILLVTRNTGLIEDPTLIILGDFAGNVVTWTCTSPGLGVGTPRRCHN